jgi:hypothetical protein
MARTLLSEHDNVSHLVTQLGRDADVLEGVVNGTLPVSGQLIIDTFVPEPPSLLQHSQEGLGILQDHHRASDGSKL